MNVFDHSSLGNDFLNVKDYAQFTLDRGSRIISDSHLATRKSRCSIRM